MMPEKLWTFNVYLDGRGSDVIREWIKDVKMPPKAVAKMDTIIGHLQVTKKEHWHPTQIKPYTGSPGIFELRFSFKNVEYRPLGCFGPKDGEFTLLIGAIEKDWKLIPASAPETAIRRCEAVHRGENLTDDYL